MLLVLRPSILSLLQSATAYFITMCDNCYYKVLQLFLCKVRQVLQSVTILLQSAIGTVLQSATEQCIIFLRR